MNTETPDSPEEATINSSVLAKVSMFASPKVRVSILALALIVTIGALGAGISHYRYTQALTERNTAVEDARAAFEDTQKARQEAEPLLPKTLGEVMFAKGLNDLKQALSTPSCTTQITMPTPETRQEAHAQAQAAREYATQCHQHATTIRTGIEKAKVAAQKGKANETASSLSIKARHLQRYVTDTMYLDKDLHLKTQAQALIERANTQEKTITTAVENNQLNQLDSLLTDAEKIAADIEALQGKMDQARHEWTLANNTTTNTPTPAYSAEAVPTHEDTYTHNNEDTQDNYTTNTPTWTPTTPQAPTPAPTPTPATPPEDNTGGWVVTEDQGGCMAGDSYGNSSWVECP